MSIEIRHCERMNRIHYEPKLFHNSSEIEAVADRISRFPILWEGIKEEFIQSDLYQFATDKRKVQGNFMEFILNDALNKLSCDTNSVEINSIRNGDKTKSYTFCRSNSGEEISVVHNRNKTTVCGYDNILLLHTEQDAIPVIIQAKAGEHVQNGAKSGIWTLNRRSKLNKLKDPICEYYQTDDVALILVTLRDVVSAESTYPDRFDASGINLTHIDATYEEFMLHLLTISH